MSIFTIAALVLLIACGLVHIISSEQAAISLGDKSATRDELFVRGANRHFGLRTRFLFPWVHPKTMSDQPEGIRRTVAVARHSAAATLAAMVLFVVALEHDTNTHTGKGLDRATRGVSTSSDSGR
ncbi:hypothetical protein LYSHEL_02750 [Lysobacter helvus]|uniref:Uncharacterized protein n=2 Tax=Lysobacteraceae TaxID=32033 RepID=A0ABM7Q270_9GAMM|nr:hypothetical protein LYSCAS_02750 [Lysobacter caseinilyticus]BCT94404.1 hypothetical protein LYSHEL_02750 [Lysobacter helvus]